MTALTEDGSYEDLMPFLLAMQKDCHVRKQHNTRGVQWEGERERDRGGGEERCMFFSHGLVIAGWCII
jgi:hypothetical protein